MCAPPEHSEKTQMSEKLPTRTLAPNGLRGPVQAEWGGPCSRGNLSSRSFAGESDLWPLSSKPAKGRQMISKVKLPPVPEARQPVLSKEPRNALTKTLIADLPNPAYSRN